MKYKKPTCDCGNELRFLDILMCKRPINGDGSVYWRLCIDESDAHKQILNCPRCGADYDFYIDHKNNKIFRGSSLSK
jgi:hypothetical protein